MVQVLLQLQERAESKRQQELGEHQRKVAEGKETKRKTAALKPQIEVTLKRENETVYAVRIKNLSDCRYHSIFYYDVKVGNVLKPDGILYFLLAERESEPYVVSGSVVRTAAYSDFQNVGYPSIIDISLYDKDGNLWAIGLSVKNKPNIGETTLCDAEDPELVAVGE